VCLFYRLRLNTFSILSKIFICCLNYYIFDEQFVVYDVLSELYSYIILFRCIAKANYSGEDTVYSPCHTILQQSPFNVSGGQSQQRPVFQHESFLLAFVKLQTWHFALFSPGTFHSPVSIFTLTLCTHTLTTVYAT